MKRFYASAAALAIALAGCSSTGTNTLTSPGGTTLSSADAQSISDETQSDVQDVTEGGSLFRFLSPGFWAPPQATRILRGPFFFQGILSGCPLLSPYPPVDSDSDGVPDSLTLAFNPSSCTFSRHDGRASLVLSGDITITDPSTTQQGFRIDYGDFQQTTTIQDSIFFLRGINGVWEVLKDTTGFTATDSTTVTDSSSQYATRTLAKAWQVSFVADSGNFSGRWHLPSGDYTINGTTTRTHGTATHVLGITTVTPLHRDASCDAFLKIVSGELQVSHTDSAGTGTIQIVFNPCGQSPTVTTVP
ncbi:MAG TPA: hypothetical protein VMG41_14615 [Gemmatimonadales bacterium]|nr:hypothetical protein [Gemmatimonadales bacterium]